MSRAPQGRTHLAVTRSSPRALLLLLLLSTLTPSAQFSTSSASTDRMCATRLRDEVTLLSAVLPDGIDVSISTTATGIKNATCPKGGATPLRSGRHRDVNPAHAHGRFSAIGHKQSSLRRPRRLGWLFPSRLRAGGARRRAARGAPPRLFERLLLFRRNSHVVAATGMCPEEPNPISLRHRRTGISAS